MQHPLPYCPSCGQLDQTRKVSGLYTGSTRWSADSDGMHGESFSSSILATRLGPPLRPKPHTGFEAGWRGLLNGNPIARVERRSVKAYAGARAIDYSELRQRMAVLATSSIRAM